MLKPSDIRDMLDRHDMYFQHRRERLREMRRLYLTRFWEDDTGRAGDGVLRTEVPKAYAVVESYLGSLYAKNPSVRVEPDIRDRGTPYDDAVIELSRAYVHVFLEFADTCQQRLRMAPIIGGIFAGNHYGSMQTLTCTHSLQRNSSQSCSMG